MDLPTKPWLRDDRVVVIARQTMTREFWARFFKEERGISPECFATLDEWVDAGRAPDPCLVVLYQSGLVKTDALAEVERLSAQAAHSPVVIVPDNEDPSVIVQMLAKKVRGYVHGCWGVPLDRIAMNCTGLDLEVRDEQMKSPDRPRRADIGLDEDAVVVATSGSFHYRKGVDIWVEAAALLRARYPGKKLKFMWIGGSEGQRTLTLYGSAVTSLVSEYGLTDDVIFAGDQRYVYPYLDACDIYVQPSRDDAFPHATLEAMAVSKPVVAFPEGVAREPYAQHALVRVDEYSPEALADGVSKLIESPGLRQKLGQLGSQVVETHFNVAESVRRFEEILMKASTALARGAFARLLH